MTTRIDWSASGEDQFLSIGGVSLEAKCWGASPDTSLTLVLLHEGLGSVVMWRDFPQRLSEATDAGVFAYSRQGYGKSDPCELPRPLDYMEREARDVLPKVLDAAGIGQAILIGHSDGASIAALHQGFADDDRIRGLVLMAPHFFVEDLSISSIENARVAWRETDLPERLGRYHTDPANAFLGWNQAWLDPGFRDWDITWCIDRFRVPCLAIQGRLDEYGSARQVEVIAERSPATVDVHLLDDCEHSPFRDARSETLDLITAFRSRVSARPEDSRNARDWPFPDQPHVPGKTPRPTESPAFDAAQAAPIYTLDRQWRENAAYLYGIDLYNAGYFWEAHEVWEAVWARAAGNSRERLLLQGLIQLSNACLKILMERREAARRLLEIAREKLSEAAHGGPTVMGVEISVLSAGISTFDDVLTRDCEDADPVLRKRPKLMVRRSDQAGPA